MKMGKALVTAPAMVIAFSFSAHAASLGDNIQATPSNSTAGSAVSISDNKIPEDLNNFGERERFVELTALVKRRVFDGRE